MYKLFLCLRYLRSRIIAYFAVIGVALCVFMMLVAVSVMTGFVEKMEQAAKGLFGDVVVESGLSGIGYYDEFIAEVKREVPEVQDASPFILTYGILRVPRHHYRGTVQIAGIRLPERARVTDFENGLFVQHNWPAPTFDPPIGEMLKRVEAETAATEAIRLRESKELQPDKLPPEKVSLLIRLDTALSFQAQSAAILRRAAKHEDRMRRLQERLKAARAARDKVSEQQIDDLEEELGRLAELAGYRQEDYHIILGLGIQGFIVRTDQGQTCRIIGPGQEVTLTLIPLGETLTGTTITPNTATFTVVDDCQSGVAPIDAELVYVPLETLQRLNNMAAEYDADDPTLMVRPARCTQIHIKVKGEFLEQRRLERVARKIEALWAEFRDRRPNAASGPVSVMTWRERQVKIIRPIERQRTLVVTMFGIISLVSVVLIFVIFYTIVVQKTRDIGVMKAVGASSGGVAQIFLAYGASIGLLGSILGCVGGYYFVTYINEVQDAIDRWFGFRVWSRDWFMFEKIPNEVDVVTAVVIVVGAIAAGVVGALIPAVRAGRMQPVEALRYE